MLHQRTIRARPYAEYIDCVGRKALALCASGALFGSGGGATGGDKAATAVTTLVPAALAVKMKNLAYFRWEMLPERIVRYDPERYPIRSDFDRVYFCVEGFAGVGAGVAGCVLAGADFTPCSTELGPPCLMA